MNLKNAELYIVRFSASAGFCQRTGHDIVSHVRNEVPHHSPQSVFDVHQAHTD
jgi:hypothetical protein